MTKAEIIEYAETSKIKLVWNISQISVKSKIETNKEPKIKKKSR